MFLIYPFQLNILIKCSYQNKTTLRIIFLEIIVEFVTMVSVHNVCSSHLCICKHVLHARTKGKIFLSHVSFGLLKRKNLNFF